MSQVKTLASAKAVSVQPVIKTANEYLLEGRCLRDGPGLTEGTKTFSAFTPPLIQPKLKIGAPNDKYEQEADRVAEQAMNNSE